MRLELVRAPVLDVGRDRGPAGVAADLAGVVLTKPELEVASKVVRAEIVNHPQDESAAGAAGSSSGGKKGGGGCVIS